MNILTETKRKLQFYNDRLKELQDCLDAEYSEILKKLEE